MQTFVPVEESFEGCVAVLDNVRLNKQVLEATQVLAAILELRMGWKNHPAVWMWKYDAAALYAYTLNGIDECSRRGIRTAGHLLRCIPLAEVLDARRAADNAAQSRTVPPWWGDPSVHRSHRSMLLQKNPEHYGRYFAPEDEPAYWWPIMLTDTEYRLERRGAGKRFFPHVAEGGNKQQS